jgi:GcrA cell cycle regulator
VKWTPSHIYELCDRWKAGESVNQIARAMNLSRNAVAGKVRRMGMSDRGSPIKGRTPKPTKDAVRMKNLHPRSCRAPLGGFYDKAEWFCGKNTGSVLQPYCEDCRKVMWIKPAKGADRPANVEWMLRHERVRA